MNEDAKSMELKVLNQTQFLVMKTKGEGDCSFHGILGEWDEAKQMFICVDADEKRKKIYETIIDLLGLQERKGDKDCNINIQLQELCETGIKELIMSSRSIGKETAKLLEKFQSFLSEQDKLTPQLWVNFEKELEKYDVILEYINKNSELFMSSLRVLFYNALSKKDGELYARMFSLPELYNAFQVYNIFQNMQFDWQSHFNKEIIKEYAAFICEPKQWLLPHELAIIGCVFRITIVFYPQAQARPLIFNRGQEKIVHVQFDGSNHYERLEKNMGVIEFIDFEYKKKRKKELQIQLWQDQYLELAKRCIDSFITEKGKVNDAALKRFKIYLGPCFYKIWFSFLRNKFVNLIQQQRCQAAASFYSTILSCIKNGEKDFNAIIKIWYREKIEEYENSEINFEMEQILITFRFDEYIIKTQFSSRLLSEYKNYINKNILFVFNQELLPNISESGNLEKFKQKISEKFDHYRKNHNEFKKVYSYLDINYAIQLRSVDKDYCNNSLFVIKTDMQKDIQVRLEWYNDQDPEYFLENVLNRNLKVGQLPVMQCDIVDSQQNTLMQYALKKYTTLVDLKHKELFFPFIELLYDYGACVKNNGLEVDDFLLLELENIFTYTVLQDAIKRQLKEDISLGQPISAKKIQGKEHKEYPIQKLDQFKSLVKALIKSVNNFDDFYIWSELSQKQSFPRLGDKYDKLTNQLALYFQQELVEKLGHQDFKKIYFACGYIDYFFKVELSMTEDMMNQEWNRQFHVYETILLMHKLFYFEEKQWGGVKVNEAVIIILKDILDYAYKCFKLSISAIPLLTSKLIQKWVFEQEIFREGMLCAKEHQDELLKIKLTTEMEEKELPAKAVLDSISQFVYFCGIYCLTYVKNPRLYNMLTPSNGVDLLLRCHRKRAEAFDFIKDHNRESRINKWLQRNFEHLKELKSPRGKKASFSVIRRALLEGCQEDFLWKNLVKENDMALLWLKTCYVFDLDPEKIMQMEQLQVAYDKLKYKNGQFNEEQQAILGTVHCYISILKDYCRENFITSFRHIAPLSQQSLRKAQQEGTNLYSKMLGSSKNYSVKSLASEEKFKGRIVYPPVPENNLFLDETWNAGSYGLAKNASQPFLRYAYLCAFFDINLELMDIKQVSEICRKSKKNLLKKNNYNRVQALFTSGIISEEGNVIIQEVCRHILMKVNGLYTFFMENYAESCPVPLRLKSEADQLLWDEALNYQIRLGKAERDIYLNIVDQRVQVYSNSGGGERHDLSDIKHEEKSSRLQSLVKPLLSDDLLSQQSGASSSPLSSNRYNFSNSSSSSSSSHRIQSSLSHGQEKYSQ